MRLLALDTLGPALSVVATLTGPGGGLVAERVEAGERGQAERILPLVEAVLAEASWSWRELDLLVVTAGPGGFTAIRTGIALVRALALALDRPVLAVGTLEVMAEAAAALVGPGPVLVLKDLRREQIAAQPFAADLVPVAPPALLGLEAALAAALAAPRLAGDGAAALAAMLAGRKLVVEAAPSARYGAAAACRRLARGERPMAGTELRPCYLRAPDAQPAAGRPLVTAIRAALPAR